MVYQNELINFKAVLSRISKSIVNETHGFQ